MVPIETRSFLRSADILRRVLGAVQALLILAGLAVLALMLLNPALLADWLTSGRSLELAPLRTWQGVALALIMLLHIVIWSAIVWRGREMFGALLLADPTAAAEAARKAAVLLWFMLLWGVLAQTLATLIVTWHAPPGGRSLSIALGSSQFSTLIAALLASFTAHAFTLGAALWQDTREVI